jgi:RecA-family ATPase
MTQSTSDRLVCTVAPVEAVLRLAATYSVFPCRRTPEEIVVRGKTRVAKAKSPLTVRGLHDATQDQDRIRAWWNRWPDALVGVPTGSRTALVVVDYDADKIDEHATSWVQDHTPALMSTRVHGTLSGGRHYLFRNPDGLEYRTGVCLELGGVKRQGIDLRAEGGYIIWWPLHGGNAQGDIGPLPAGLVDERRIEKIELPQLPEKTPESWARERAQVAAALVFHDASNYDEWRNAGMAIKLASAGCDDGFGLWHSWSSGELTGDTPASYAGVTDCRYHWDSYKNDKARGGLITLGTLFEIAKARGYVPARVPRGTSDELPPLEAYSEFGGVSEQRYQLADPPQEQPATDSPLREMPKPDLATASLPAVRFTVESILPRRFVTLLGGHGDVGKSYLSLAIAAHVACGRQFADLSVPVGKALYVSLEDEAELAWLRLRRIAEAYELNLSAVEAGITILDVPDDGDAALAYEHSEAGVRRLLFTPALEQIRARAAGHDIVIVDNASDAYDANEGERRLVRRFVKALQRIAKQHDLALVLLAHIDKAAARFGSAGEHYSGSTAWHNSVRSRLALLEHDGRLELVQEKSNHGKPLGHPIVLTRNEVGVPMPLSKAEREHASAADTRAILAAIKAAKMAGLSVPTAISGSKPVTQFLATRPEIPPDLAISPQRMRIALAQLEREQAIWREEYRDAVQRKMKERFTCAE